MDSCARQSTITPGSDHFAFYQGGTVSRLLWTLQSVSYWSSDPTRQENEEAERKLAVVYSAYLFVSCLNQMNFLYILLLCYVQPNQSSDWN